MDRNLQDNENQQMNRNTMTSDNRNPLQSNQKKDDWFSVFKAPYKKFLEKSKDIDILSQMRQSIIDYETGQSQIKDVLKIIGDLSGKITYNDNNDPESEYIRNKYGFIRRNKNKSISKNGIYFESLSYFKVFLSDDFFAKEIISKLYLSDDKWDNLGPELSSMKKKIDLILSEQNSTNDNRESFKESNIDISKLTGFAMKYHEQMVLFRIIRELDSIESINFHIKEDRYIFGRAFSIIGEVINEWYQYQENEERQMLIKTLKQFIKLRHNFVRLPKRINSLTKLDNESINKIIVELKKYLNFNIMDNQSNGNVLEINHSYNSIEEFNKLLNELSALLLIKTLKTFIKLRNDLVHNHERINSLTESDNESINKIIVELKNHLRFIITVNESDKHLKINNPYNSTEEFNKLLNDLSELLFGKSMKAKKNTKKNEDEMSNDEKIKKKLRQYIKRAYKIIVGTSEQSNINNESINKENKILQSINENYEKNLNNLSEEERKNFPSKLDSDHIEEMKSFQNHLVQKKITVIMEEMKYIFYFIKKLLIKNKMPFYKTTYIFQYSMLVIGQLVRDIEDFNICQSNHNGGDSKFNNQSDSADLTWFTQSNVIQEVASILKTLRNQGLAHNVWNFDGDSFIKIVDQIGSLIEQFEQFDYLIKKDLMPENCKSLYHIGCSLIKSHKYVEAKDYLEKFQTRLSDYPNEAEGQIFDQYSDLEKICHMKPILWSTLIKLAFAYSKIGNSEKSKELAFYLLEQVDYDEDSDVDAFPFPEFFEHLCKIFMLLKDHLEPNVYIELLESFYERYGKFIFLVSLGIFYSEQNNYENAKKVFIYIFENSPQTSDKIHSFKGCLDICSEKYRLDQISEIETVLDPMVAWFSDKEIDLPLDMLEFYFFAKLDNIALRLKSITYNNGLDGINESEVIKLRELSTQLKEFFTKLRNFNFLLLNVDAFIQTSCIFILVLSLDIGTGLDASLVPNIFKQKPEMTPIQMENMTTLSKIITHLINKDRELKKRNPHPTNERNGLSMKESGDCLYQYAVWFLTIFGNNHSNYGASWLSKILFPYAMKCLREFVKYCDGQINPPLITDAEFKIGYCHCSIYLFSYDLFGLQSCISRIKCMLTEFHTLDGVYRIFFKETIELLEDTVKGIKQDIELLEDIRDETISVLNQILEAPNDDFKLSFHDKFVVSYLAKHFNIRINENNSGKSLIYGGTFDELQNKIRLHINSNNLNVDETNKRVNTRS